MGAWTIEQFDLKAEIHTDGSVLIQETIQANFGENSFKHGIIRDIPTQFEDENGDLFRTPITNVSVLKPNQLRHRFVQSKNGANVSLKIGDPNQYVPANETYIIRYQISGVLNAFEGHDEFYWNVTGNEWEAPIQQASAKIALPDSSPALKATCFTGVDGSTTQNCDSEINEAQTSAQLSTVSILNPGEGFTVVVGWDKGLVAIPERETIFDLQGLFEQIQYLFLLFPAWALQRTYRIRNALKVNKAVIPLYHPPEGLGVGLIGYFDRGKPHTRDLSALLTQLAVKGLIHIKEIAGTGVFKKTTYEITRFENQAITLDAEEKYVYDLLPIAPGETLSLEALAKKQYSIFRHERYQGLIKLIRGEIGQYFRSSSLNPLKVLGIVTFGFFFCFLTIVFSAIAESFIPFLSLIVGGAIALYLPQFNKEGQLIKHDIKGYKKFLTTADKERINWSEAQNIFEKNLPYAIALNLTDKWAQIFGDKIQNPEWFESPSQRNFNGLQKGLTASTATSIRSTAPRTSTRSTSSSRRSSGFSRGGGRSGGGFGGGGGSSW